jgi:hypothetical protein
MSWRSAKAAALSSSRELKLAYPSLASLESKKGLGGAASASWILVALVLLLGVEGWGCWFGFEASGLGFLVWDLGLRV